VLASVKAAYATSRTLMRIEPLLSRAVSSLVVVGCAVLSLSATAGSEIHRCIDGSRVTYTDRGCTDQGEVLAITSIAPLSANTREEVGGYGRAMPIALGMSPRMVYDTLGRPFETVATLEGQTLVEYWMYRGADGTTRIAFQEGRVTRIHTR
jgi:hypothetical protein